MITRLRLQNFKAWKDSGEILLAPITVFFGANSSGKTSIQQLLLMLKQTALSPDRRRVLHLGDSEAIVDLGTYQEVVFGHDETSHISFEIDWKLPEPLRILQRIKKKKSHSIREISFSAEIAQKASGLVVQRMDYKAGDSSNSNIEVRMEPKINERNAYDVHVKGYELVRRLGRAWPLPPPARFYGFPNEIEAYYQNAEFLSDLALAFERMLSSLCYVGPLRDYPDRSYSWSGQTPDHVGVDGRRVIEAILSARERKISPKNNAKNHPFEKVIARWLKQMGLIEDFEAKPLAPGRKTYEVLVRVPGSKVQVNLTDVGFGVSQFLPILVECFYVPTSSTIIFEQPELHLHPGAQSNLADLFIETINSREDGQDRNIQLVIESHSEHFLRRLQRRIAEQKIDPGKTALYFCVPSPNGSRIHRLQVDKFGNITNWPADFFGDEVGDLAAMTEAAIEREASQ